MARTQAISMLQEAAKKGDLAEIYGIVIDNIMKDTLSSGLKSQAYSGNPAAGSVEFKRFTNSKAKEYGTARAAGKGDALTAPSITVNLDQHREIVEEASKFDLDTFGVTSIMARRAANHIDTTATELDVAFFAAAAGAATKVEPNATETLAKIEEMIVTLETVKNDYVRGINRNMINVVLSPTLYSEVRAKLDILPNSNVDTAAEAFAMYHGVKFYNCLNLPENIQALVMAQDSVAEPVVSYPYSNPEKIPLSNDYAISMFYDYGTKALTPDLIFKMEAAAE